MKNNNDCVEVSISCINNAIDVAKNCKRLNKLLIKKIAKLINVEACRLYKEGCIKHNENVLNNLKIYDKKNLFLKLLCHKPKTELLDVNGWNINDYDVEKCLYVSCGFINIYYAIKDKKYDLYSYVKMGMNAIEKTVIEIINDYISVDDELLNKLEKLCNTDTNVAYLSVDTMLDLGYCKWWIPKERIIYKSLIDEKST